MIKISLLKLIAVTCICLPKQLGVVDGIPVDNGLIGSEIIRECAGREAVDLGFILDGSGSIGDLTFENQKNFVNMLLEELPPIATDGNEGTRVGVVQFATEPRLEIPFGSEARFRNKLSLQGGIARIPFLSGTTRTGAALSFARDQLFGRPGATRGGDVPKVLVILTDGQSQDSVAGPAAALRSDDILIYAIGITNLINANELRQITGRDSRVFTVESFEDLNTSLTKLIVAEMCRTEFRPGEPEIVCTSDSIGVRARSKKPFGGHVFVKNHFHTEGCRRGAESFLGSPNNEIGLTVPLNSCNVRRYRSLEPRGVFIEAEIVFMFHDSFMTKVDQGIRVQCFYMEAEKTVNVPLDISMLTTSFVERTYPMPTCFYTLHLGSADGPEIEFAEVGSKVVHRWECIEQEENYDIFGMLVHDCVVDDSLGNEVLLIDSNGCGVDRHLVDTPEYSRNLRLATRETHVFKYADRPVLQFQCQVSICYRGDGSCDGITPPECSTEGRDDSSNGAALRELNQFSRLGNFISARRRRAKRNSSAAIRRKRRGSSRKLPSETLATFDIISRQLTVIPPQSTLRSPSKSSINSNHLRSSRAAPFLGQIFASKECISMRSLLLFVIVSLAIYTWFIVMGFVFYRCVRSWFANK